MNNVDFVDLASISVRTQNCAIASFCVPESVPPQAVKYMVAALDEYILPLCRTIQFRTPIRFEIGDRFVLDAPPKVLPLEIELPKFFNYKVCVDAVACLPRDSCTAVLLADVVCFPSRTVSLLRFDNGSYVYEPSTTFDRDLLQHFMTNKTISSTGAYVPESFQQVPLEPSEMPIPALVATAQIEFSAADADTPNHNYVLLILATNSRNATVSNQRLVAKSSITKCIKALKESSTNILSRSPLPIEALEIIRNSERERLKTDLGLSAPKQCLTSSTSKVETKTSTKIERDTKEAKSADNNQTSSDAVPSNPPQDKSSSSATAVHKEEVEVPSQTSEAKKTKKGKKKAPERKEPVSTKPSSPKGNRNAKRRRVEDDESKETETAHYMESIVDSISAIVSESTNPDFVTACFSTLGISTSTTICDDSSSSERRMAEFRKIMERDIQTAYESSQRYRKASRNSVTSNGKYSDLEELEDEEDEEWMVSLTEAEIDALWTPQPVIPSDSNWHDQLWVPCPFKIDESEFEVVPM